MMASTHHPQYYRIPPASARRLLVLRHGPSARLQGVAIVAGYEPPVQRSAYGRRDPRFDFCRRERVLFIGTEFSILYTSMHSPA